MPTAQALLTYLCDNTQMYQKILFADLTFPETIAPDAKDFMTKLLEREPKGRLGYGPDGTEQIKCV